MIKIKDLDDLSGVILVVRQAIKAAKLGIRQEYQVGIKLFWPMEGVYHLDAEVLMSIVAKEMRRIGLDMHKQILACGLHQHEGHAGEIEIRFEPLDRKTVPKREG